jgi:lipopolysaccharide/colanic/teichoic acid biosynthesis glycosyltransferase
VTEVSRTSRGADVPARLPTVPVAPTPVPYRTAKRILDVMASSIGLILSSPLLLAIAAAIRMESPGEILFRQERVGLGGRTFRLYKFRTMHSTADQETHRRHVEQLIRGEASEEPAARGGATWIPLEADQRVTRVGRFLRRSHLDELPQLINVLRGEMSVVGPRPPIPYEVAVYEPWHLRRLSVIPGLTGLWQVRGWGKLSFDEGVALDLEYIESRSFFGDLGLVLRTLWQIVRGRQF